jgi:hypothetical protein
MVVEDPKTLIYAEKSDFNTVQHKYLRLSRYGIGMPDFQVKIRLRLYIIGYEDLQLSEQRFSSPSPA